MKVFHDQMPVIQSLSKGLTLILVCRISSCNEVANCNPHPLFQKHCHAPKRVLKYLCIRLLMHFDFSVNSTLKLCIRYTQVNYSHNPNESFNLPDLQKYVYHLYLWMVMYNFKGKYCTDRTFSEDPILALLARIFSLLKLCIANNIPCLLIMCFRV